MAQEQEYVGSTLGLPKEGRGSLATWNQRVAAVIGDWAACMVVAIALFGWGVMNESGWKSWMILVVFFVQSAILTTLAGGSFGQLIAGIGVARIDGQPLGFWRPTVRSVLKCLVIPVVVIGAERQHIADMLLRTAVLKRRD